jgi:ssDNA-binding Zn-finger/Zn-ribbon topoisomerase 1
MTEKNIEQKLIAAYDKMMERVEHLLDAAEQQALPALQKNIDKAKQQAIELKEITKEEAEKIGDYLRRDLHDAAEHLESSGKEFSSWFSFDLKLIEDRVLDIFVKVADKTRFELAQLAEQAKRAQEYHTGEITSIGTLACQECETLLHFKKTSRIPPCPKCHKTVFVRTRRRKR